MGRSIYYGVHNDEDEVAHVGERPETQYEQPRAVLSLPDDNGARHSGDCEGDRGRESIRQNLWRSGLSRNAKSTRTGKLIISKRTADRIVLRLFKLHRRYATTRVGGRDTATARR